MQEHFGWLNSSKQSIQAEANEKQLAQELIENIDSQKEDIVAV